MGEIVRDLRRALAAAAALLLLGGCGIDDGIGVRDRGADGQPLERSTADD
jgi:hypothetical protein